jgi:hypothetical protein
MGGACSTHGREDLDVGLRKVRWVEHIVRMGEKNFMQYFSPYISGRARLGDGCI